MPRWAKVAGHTLWFYYAEEHHRPHVAVRGDHRATVDLATGAVLAGRLPPKLRRVVREFLREHRDEAYAAWRATQAGQPPGKIPEER